MARSSGIGVYLRHVVRSLIDDYADDFRITLLGGEPVAGVARQKACAAPIYSVAELIEVPVRVPTDTDVLWSPNYNAPVVSPGRLVVTVHDMCHLALPELFGGMLKQTYAKAMFANVKRRAERVMCVSEFTASEMVRLTGIDRSRITVIYEGVDPSWRRPVDSPRPFGRPYLLYVGNVKPHKNLGRLLQAFERVMRRIPNTLVIVGQREGFITPDRSIIADAERLGDRVHFTGHVSDELLRSYYAHSDLLVFPSLYEGFGFPPLEAMATGIPVAASSAASIPEICGDAVTYFDPYSIEEMSDVIERALSDDALRSSLRQRGAEQVKRYSWPETASRIASVLRDVAAS